MSAIPANPASASASVMTNGWPPALALVATRATGCGSSSHAVPRGCPATAWNSK